MAFAAGLIVVVTAFGSYLATASRDIVFGDSPELTGVAITLGVAHPPGYPLWTLLAHVFTWLPIGTLPFRVSVFSIAAAVGAIAVSYVVALRLTRSVIAAATAAAVVAFTPVIWRWSVVPEVFALNDLLAAALIGLLIEWHRSGDERFFVAAALIGGLGMAHQQTIALVGLGVVVLMWHHRRRFRGGGLLIRSTAAVVVGLLPYVYLPVAASTHPAWNWGDISSLEDLVGHVLRNAYGTAALVSDPRFQGGSVIDRLVALARSFSAVEALLGGLGFAYLFRRDRALFWFLGVAAFGAGPAFIAYSNTNLSVAVLQAVLERFFMLVHVILAPVTAVGVVCIGELAAARVGPLWRRRASLVTAAAAVAVTIAVAAATYGTLDQATDRTARQYGVDLLSAVRPGAIFLAGGDPVVGSVGYLRTIEGARPDITYVQLPLLRGDWYVRQLHRDYPALVLRSARFDGVTGTMRGLVDANGAEKFDVIGQLLDDSLASTYGLYRRGLVQQLHLKSAPVDLDVLAKDNDAALASYHPPDPVAVADRPWDRLILADYGLVASDVGAIFDRSKRYSEARQWYLRALQIAPDLIEAKAGLAALPAAGP